MNRKMIGEAIYNQSRAEGNNTECVGKKRFNGRVLPTATGFGKSMCYVPPFCFWTRYYIFFSYGYSWEMICI
jgi:hypothetical protein